MTMPAALDVTSPPTAARRPSRWPRVGVWLALGLGLAATGHAVFSPAVRAAYADVADSVDITQWGQKATWATVPGWWAGAWIQHSSPYYRPLSSMLFWAEVRAFGRDFLGHAVMSWALHGAICVLLYLLALRWFPGPPGRRAAFALLAVVLFNLRRGPQGPGWIPAPVAYGVVAWWPGQTDQACLLFALLCLLDLDTWLVEGGRRRLWRGLAWWVVALLFKEMAVCVPLVAGCQILLRRGRPALALWGQGAEGEGARQARVAPGLAWRVVTPWLAVVAGFLAARPYLVPGAWGPQARDATYFATKVAWFLAEAPWAVTRARWPWVVVVAAFVVACLYLYARLARRPSPVWLVVVMILGSGLLAQLAKGNFAIITIPLELEAVGIDALFILGLVVLAHVRSGPAWLLLAMVAAVHLPILEVKGPHYMYWPSAFWGLFNASLVQYVWQAHVEGRLQWRRRGDGSRVLPA
jgi:hypothetical protein